MMTAAPRGYDQGGERNGGGPRQDPRMFRNSQNQRGGGNQGQRGGQNQRGGAANFNHHRQQQQQQGQDPQQQQGGHDEAINLRMILTKEEVSYLFGFDGVLINQLRQQTGANIQITDPSHEQVLTICGPLDILFKAFSLVCRKLYDFVQEVSEPGSNPHLVLRFSVPMSQCGMIIGKQGAKVREIRDLTRAEIRVSQESLPESTERCVEVSGQGESCLQCTYHICTILQEAPIRGELIPYIPKSGQQPGGGGGGGFGGGPNPMMGGQQNQMPSNPNMNDNWKPVFLCGERAFIMDGNVARPAPPEMLKRELAQTPMGAGGGGPQQMMGRN